jgi:hypothetical protein
MRKERCDAAMHGAAAACAYERRATSMLHTRLKVCTTCFCFGRDKLHTGLSVYTLVDGRVELLFLLWMKAVKHIWWDGYKNAKPSQPLLLSQLTTTAYVPESCIDRKPIQRSSHGQAASASRPRPSCFHPPCTHLAQLGCGCRHDSV